MPVESFAFAPAVVAAASDGQRAFLDELAAIVRATRPRLLDLDAVTATVDERALRVELPHRLDPQQHVAVAVMAELTAVAYGIEVERFWPGDPQDERLWPVDDLRAEHVAVRFVEQLFIGRVQLDIRQRPLFRSTRSYWMADDGRLERFARGEAFRPTLAVHGWRHVHVDFGPSPEGFSDNKPR